MARWILLCLMFFGVLRAEEARIELVANFNADTQSLETMLAQMGSKVQLSASDLSKYDLSRQKWFAFLRKPLALAASKMVFYNLTSKQAKLELQRLPKEKLVLFMWEPPLILPKMYKEKVQNLFSKIYTFNDALVDHQRYFKFCYPTLRQMIQDVIPFKQKKLCALFSSNFSSKREGSLYTERQAWVAFFEAQQEAGFALYGRGWRSEEHPSYQGFVEDKLSTLKQFRFNICYENCDNVPGYITEKVFDCFEAGVVPVYLGPPNVTDYIPKECFIDPREFATKEALYTYLKNMSAEEYEGYLTSIRAFLSSDKAKLFSMEHFVKTFQAAISDDDSPR